MTKVLIRLSPVLLVIQQAHLYMVMTPLFLGNRLLSFCAIPKLPKDQVLAVYISSKVKCYGFDWRTPMTVATKSVCSYWGTSKWSYSYLRRQYLTTMYQPSWNQLDFIIWHRLGRVTSANNKSDFAKNEVTSVVTRNVPYNTAPQSQLFATIRTASIRLTKVLFGVHHRKTTPQKFVNPVRALYPQSYSLARIYVELVSSFETITSVRQEYLISPSLHNFVIDEVMEGAASLYDVNVELREAMPPKLSQQPLACSNLRNMHNVP